MFSNKRKFLVKLLLILSFTIVSAQDKDSKVDINTADKKALSTLPLSNDQVLSILHYRIIYGKFESVHELLRVEKMDNQTFVQIKPLIIVSKDLNKDYRIQKTESMYYKLSQFASEGTNDNEADNFIDLALNPNNVNKMSYQQLANLPNVTPIDASRIRFHVENIGDIYDLRGLRNVDALDHYGYVNVRDFVTYKDGLGNDNKLHGFYTYRTYDTDFIGEEGDVFANVGDQTHQEENRFNKYHKLRLTYNEYRTGFSYSKNLGEPDHSDIKAFVSRENLKITDDIIIEDVILGNYKVTFGHGIVMENTDFFTPRKDGFGFKKRYQGIIGDISRSRNHDLFGLALKARLYENTEFTGFISKSKRDAILSSDGDIISFINLKQRFEEDYLRHSDFAGFTDQPNIEDKVFDSVPNMSKNVDEFTFGGELKYNFAPGTYIAATMYESWYSRRLRPDMRSLFIDDQKDNFDGAFKNNELVNGVYGDRRSDIDGDPDYKSFRRIYGLHGQIVLNKWAFSGELGVLDTDVPTSRSYLGADSLVSSSSTYTPKAFILSSYYQQSNFNILLMYRDYDLGYDNPYQHSLSNYQRFKSTMIDDSYRLKSPYYTQLYFNADQPQAERGFHLRARYRVSSAITFTTENGLWERVSDGIDQYRFVLRGEFRPFYALRFNVRQKWQARDEDNKESIDYFYNNESRIRVTAYLSARDQVGLVLGRSYTQFPVRPNLTFNPNINNDNPYDNIRGSIFFNRKCHRF